MTIKNVNISCLLSSLLSVCTYSHFSQHIAADFKKHLLKFQHKKDTPYLDMNVKQAQEGRQILTMVNENLNSCILSIARPTTGQWSNFGWYAKRHPGWYQQWFAWYVSAARHNMPNCAHFECHISKEPIQKLPSRVGKGSHRLPCGTRCTCLPCSESITSRKL